MEFMSINLLVALSSWRPCVLRRFFTSRTNSELISVHVSQWNDFPFFLSVRRKKRQRCINRLHLKFDKAASLFISSPRWCIISSVWQHFYTLPPPSFSIVTRLHFFLSSSLAYENKEREKEWAHRSETKHQINAHLCFDIYIYSRGFAQRKQFLR